MRGEVADRWTAIQGYRRLGESGVIEIEAKRKL
jgi:hypothetical protein